MILTDYYKAEKLLDRKTRFDITASTGEYDLFETILENKRGFNVGGLSLNFGKRPDKWKGKGDYALTKNRNITTVIRPDIESNFAYGDINGTQDACIIIFKPSFKEVTGFEIFIARGYRNDKNSLWNSFIEGDLDFEVKALRDKAVTEKVTQND